MYDRIFTANRAWVAKMLAEDEDFFEDLATDRTCPGSQLMFANHSESPSASIT